jgi:hypothetical protein
MLALVSGRHQQTEDRAFIHGVSLAKQYGAIYATDAEETKS